MTRYEENSPTTELLDPIAGPIDADGLPGEYADGNTEGIALLTYMDANQVPVAGVYIPPSITPSPINPPLYPDKPTFNFTTL